MTDVRANAVSVMERVKEAAIRSGRNEDAVRLIAVTKFVEPERIQPAIDSGCREVGENRAQDFSEKLTFFKQNQCRAHFIGQLQTNKLKYVCGKADLIHSVDRQELAMQMERYCARFGITQEILLQVNIGDEPQKGGVGREELPALMEMILAQPHLLPRGLMCVPPAVGQDEARRYFAALYEMLQKLKGEYPSLPLTELSMGMSADFEAAILEGSTMVRVGSGIFGKRFYQV